MFERDLRRFRDSVRAGDYDVTKHALEEMDADGLSIPDLETCVLEGSIVERQLDRLTGERKHIIEGPASDGLALSNVAKRRATGRMTILTGFRS